MSVVPDVMELSDIEDDCVLESVIYVNYKCLNKKKYDHIYKENPLLAKFIEKCYDIENSQGMSTVINKSLITHYNETNKAYKTSLEFKKVLNRSISMLETDPKKIFSHIKELCIILKSASVKRIKPITLSTNLKDNVKLKCPEIVSNGLLKRKNSDNNECNISKVYIIDSDKVSHLTEGTEPINNNIVKSNSIIHIEKENKSTLNESGSEDDNKLLVPQKILEISDVRDPLDEKKVNQLKKEIARCKTVIAKLDEQEVDDDSVNSPYIKSEKLKAKVVLLYKKICNLTGNQLVKKRMISLKVIEGHPEGPMHHLEKFLNNNIGPDGDPPFPDFSDVVECVKEANSKDNLGWTNHQILHEARALFTQCGRALQRRRQNREWQDLLHKVNLQRCDDDPADHDPALLKRLEDNKKTAVKKESEILERYSMMQTVPQTRTIVSYQLPSGITEKNEERRLDKSALDKISLSDSDVSHNLSQDSESQKNTSASENINIIEPNEVNEVKIKKEVEEEIEEKLGELGANYTLSVIEIDEDPFLIIEISDSSEDEGS